MEETYYRLFKESKWIYQKKDKVSGDRFVILGDTLFKKSMDGNLLTCLDESDAYVAVGKVHEWICGAHQVGEKIKWLLCR